MRRNRHKATPVPGGYVRRTGPTSCSVGVMPGMHVEDLRRLRLAGLLFASVLPYRVDVSWDLWAQFIERNHQWSERLDAYDREGDCLMPDDAVSFLEVMAKHHPLPNQLHPHARTY